VCSTFDPRVASAIEQMACSLDRTLRVAEVARAVNLGASHFTRLFRTATGLTPLQYLRSLRLQRARVLLEVSFFTVKEVMAAVGYNDPSHFTRDFVRAHGMTPSAVRARWVRRAIRPACIEVRSSHRNGQTNAEMANESNIERLLAIAKVAKAK
jgi:transcriptional regulator GlxA family with amidase domain